ncbi:hypothetical protein TWF481_008238 [Arthrobotrys musiformis]|uniref:Uncharacterized protein n=1 Tax=Arthrobotrys musiformis TaxID=47236 RepID=A0AAV9W6I4_9PEZI
MTTKFETRTVMDDDSGGIIDTEAESTYHRAGKRHEDMYRNHHEDGRLQPPTLRVGAITRLLPIRLILAYPDAEQWVPVPVSVLKVGATGTVPGAILGSPVPRGPGMRKIITLLLLIGSLAYISGSERVIQIDALIVDLQGEDVAQPMARGHR